ncbi:MAG: acyl-CoA dehydrogenase, partial [Alcanivorax sp.]|nr:acyl-CoA dehydrogenase [Alcanivorax sp.]
IPCFGLTGPEAGSDAGAIPDTGVICKGKIDGKEVLGMRLNFAKRWITLAPVATVVGLAFKLYDPEKLLGDKEELGITCALIPADTPGVEIGRRHYPGSPFMNGPINGKDVFVPLDVIIGGPEMAGRGWRMLIECLGAGRGVSLPALATASGEIGYRMTGAFGRIRRQFNTAVGQFEGVQEASAEVAAIGYTLEAYRHLVTRSLEDGAPSVVTAMAKYHATEMMRELINHGMDIAGGRGIQLGPRNFLALPYQSTPIAITVEGANILTRSLMIFGQGAMRCHPYLYDELQAIQAEDKKQGLQDFDALFFSHAGHTLGNISSGIIQALAGPYLSDAPGNADAFSAPWYRLVNRYSAVLSSTADMALALLGGDLKRRELLSARLGDVHSQLLIACSILKYHATLPRDEANDAHASYALRRSFSKAHDALEAFYRNFGFFGVGYLLKGLF